MDQPIGHAVISVRVTAVLSKLALWTNHVKVAHILSTDTLANCATFTGFLYEV